MHTGILLIDQPFLLNIFFLFFIFYFSHSGVEKRAWACYGNFHNFLDISCPPDRKVKLISMMNGAKPTNQGCPDMTTDMDNFRKECCTFQQGDCVIETHHNNFPVECSNLHFCRPQSRLADTWPQCNSNDFPKFTHYTEITYMCITRELFCLFCFQYFLQSYVDCGS